MKATALFIYKKACTQLGLTVYKRRVGKNALPEQTGEIHQRPTNLFKMRAPESGTAEGVFDKCTLGGDDGRAESQAIAMVGG